MTGIEPAYSAWEADALPLNYIRNWYLYIVSQVSEFVKGFTRIFAETTNSEKKA